MIKSDLNPHNPAFPTDFGTGLTQRNYFAAHAPEMPDWFCVAPSRPVPIGPIARDELNADEYREHLGVKTYDDNTKTSPKVLELQSRIRKSIVEQEEWKLEQAQHRFFAWRWYYADMMMKGGNK